VPQRRIGALVVAAAIALLPTAPAHAAQTFGSDLSRTPDESDECVGTTTCTFVQTALPGNSLPLVAPTSGVVTKWQVKTAAGPAGSVRLEVLRPTSGGQYIPVGSSSSKVTSSAGGIQTFTRQLAVQTGDAIALDQTTIAMLLAAAAPSATGGYWEPRINATSAPTGDDTGVELMFNAIVEADADGDGAGDETQDRCPGDATTTGPCPVDLAVTNTISSAQVTAGQDVTDTVVIRNLGHNTATGIQLNWGISSLAGPPTRTGDCSGASLCAIAAIAAGGSTTLTQLVRVPPSPAPYGATEAAMTSTAEAYSQLPDTDPTNNRATAGWTVTGFTPFAPFAPFAPFPATPSGPVRPRITLTVPRQQLPAVLARGLLVKARCTATCSGTLALSLAGRSAGTAPWHSAAAAPTTVRVKLTKRAVRARRKARTAQLTLRATARDAAGTQALAVLKTINLRRAKAR
jgi:hypothetical protein